MTALTDQLRIAFDQGKKVRENELLIAQFKQDPNKTPETDLEGFQNQGGYAPEPETRTPGPITPRQKGKNVRQGDSAQRRNEAARGGEQLRPEEIWPNYPNMLQIKGQPSDMGTFDIDPTKRPQTESQKRRADKLRDRKMRGGEGSGQAGDILDKLGESGVGLPNLIENINPRDLLKILQGVAAFGGSFLLPQLQMGQGEGDGTQIADASALTNYLDSAGRNQRTGSFKGTPLGNDPEKLIETLLIGAEKYKA